MGRRGAVPYNRVYKSRKTQCYIKHILGEKCMHNRRGRRLDVPRKPSEKGSLIVVIPSGRYGVRRLGRASRNLRVGAFILLDFGKGAPLQSSGLAGGSGKEIPRQEFSSPSLIQAARDDRFVLALNFEFRIFLISVARNDAQQKNRLVPKKSGM